MDRNIPVGIYKISAPVVALRKESVDRNASCEINICIAGKSLSARRAWIEIIARFKRERKGMVALRKESVDRNPVCACRGFKTLIVALRKESVDRNLCCH